MNNGQFHFMKNVSTSDCSLNGAGEEAVTLPQDSAQDLPGLQEVRKGPWSKPPSRFRQSDDRGAGGGYGEGVWNQAQMPRGPRLRDWVQAQGCSLEPPMRVGRTQPGGARLRLEL